MPTSLVQRDVQLYRQNNEIRIRYQEAYQNMVLIFNGMSIMTRDTRRFAMLVEQAALFGRARIRTPIGIDQNIGEMERLGRVVEEQVASIQAQVDELSILHTTAFEAITAGMQLANELSNVDWLNYWTPMWDNLNNVIPINIENARLALVDMINIANETRRIISEYANETGRVVQDRPQVNELMESTLAELNRFDILYAAYKDVCATRGITPKPIPADFICPLSHQIMIEPVTANAGFHSYEKAFILKWLLTNATDPLTRNQISASRFVPNTSLKNAINEFSNELTTAISEGHGRKLRSLTRKVKSKQTKRRRYKNKYSKRRR